MWKTCKLTRARCLAGGLAAALLAPSGAGAQPLQSPDAIVETARQFLQQRTAPRSDAGRTEIRMGALDRRLRLARCDQPLEGFMPPGGRLQGNTSVGVRCNGSRPWKLYVPARIRLIREVAVARGYLNRGTRIERKQILIDERDVTDASRGYVTDPAQLVGMRHKRSVKDGELIAPGVVARPMLIRKGEPVTIVSKSGAFEVRMKGEALADGIRGELIRVRNTKSRRIVEGEVAARGLVKVTL